VTSPPDEDQTDQDGVIPALVLVALKDRMHARRLSAPDDPGHIEGVLGAGDSAVCVVDDGPDHCMIGRPVGRSPDGCLYILAGRIPLFAYEQLRDGETAFDDAFSDGRDISLVAIFAVEDTVENVMVVQHYRRADRVPDAYLPPAPFLEFDEAPADEG
jgi:hypothetical protein